MNQIFIYLCLYFMPGTQNEIQKVLLLSDAHTPISFVKIKNDSII